MKTFRTILSEVSKPRSGDERAFRDKHIVQVIQHPVADYKQHSGDIDGNGVPDQRKKKNTRLADYKKGEDEAVYEEIDLDDEDMEERSDRAHRAEIKQKIIDEKKLDPVGKEDDDIDNDGDVDSSDSYLHNRRKAVTSAIRKKFHKESSELAEKAVSQAQQKAAAIALAVKKGKLPKSKLQGASKDMYGMSTKDLEDFAKTKLRGLPVKMYEDLDEAVTVNKKNYSWGKMVTVHHGSSHSFPLHPEHQEAIKNLKDGEKTSFTDETKKRIVAHREGDTIHLKHPGSNQKTPVARSHFTESVELEENQMTPQHKRLAHDVHKQLQRDQSMSLGTGLKLKADHKMLRTKYGKDWRKKAGINEEVELDEAVEVSHDRYMRSHGKKASGGTGMWMFTHKRMGDVNYNDDKEVHSARGKFSDAKKSAQEWAKKHGHSTVYVMEGVEQIDEAPGKRVSSAYRMTVPLQNGKIHPDHEEKVNALKAKVRADNTKEGTKNKVVLQGRLGKDNPNASKYRSKRTGKSYPGSHQRIKLGDASHADVYVREETGLIDEGVKEKISGLIRRQKEKDHFLQNRRDVAHMKAAKAYASGNERKGDRYMSWREKSLAKEETDLTENFKAGAVKLNDGSSVLVKDQDAKLLNQLFKDLNADNKKKMMKVAMTDKSGFNEILGFAREAL
jgi:hypothetical protein